MLKPRSAKWVSRKDTRLAFNHWKDLAVDSRERGNVARFANCCWWVPNALTTLPSGLRASVVESSKGAPLQGLRSQHTL
jgi:hypothetical protein